MAWPPVTHQDVEDDLTNGHGWASSLIGRFGVGEHLWPTPTPWIVGTYYGSPVNGAAGTTQAATANRLYLTPIYFPTSRAVDQIGINVTTAGTASHVARLGIYNSDPATSLPTTVRTDAGTVAVDTLGGKTLAISSIPAGLYWLAMTAQSGTYGAINATATAPVGGGTLTSNQSTCLIRPSTPPTSALPDLTSDGTVAPSTGNVPRVALRAA